MVELPAAEDEAERLMDLTPIRFSLDLSLTEYRRLCAEQFRRQNLTRRRITLRAIVREALLASLPEVN